MHTFNPAARLQSKAPVYYGAAVPEVSPGAQLAVLGLIIGVAAIPTFLITPWIVKQFKPEWSYGKRLATGVVVTFGVSSVIAVARAASGTSSK